MLGEILSIQPGELKFPFELKKQVSTTLRLSNVTSEYVAFKVKTTSPKKYCVRPNTGTIPPQSSREVIVTMQAQKEAPPDMQCKDKFLVQSVLLPGNLKDAAADVQFNKDAGHEIHEVKLRVVFVAPPEPPSPVAESPEEPAATNSYPTYSVNRPADPSQKDVAEWKAKWQEANHALKVMTDDRNNIQRELQAVKSKSQAAPVTEVKHRKSGWSTFFLLLIALLFFLVGFYTARMPVQGLPSTAGPAGAEL